jgi:2-polyprenyl-6-methoxyphenol hydroxylase-like FAD-dependent oxidoreductase
MPIQNIAIIGCGMAGIGNALAISKAFRDADDMVQPQITIFELRNEPSTIGGAVNLTPTALRCLNDLGVFEQLESLHLGCPVNTIDIFSLHSAASLGIIDYNGPTGEGFDGYKGRRIMRKDLLESMLNVARQAPNILFRFGKKLVNISETSDSVKAGFEDGEEWKGQMILGCDGIHSATRSTFVQPSRCPEYSGIAAAYGFSKVSNSIRQQLAEFCNETAMFMARRGALLTTYCDYTKETVYLAALMETKQQVSKDGWRALGSDQEAVKANIMERFGESKIDYITSLISATDDWFLYPVYILPPNGKWHTDRVMLLGDAAHAVSISYDTLVIVQISDTEIRCLLKEKV